MAKLFSVRPPMIFRGRKFKGLRGWSGKPLHPPLTDFPIAGYVLAAVFDVVSYFAAYGNETAEGADSGVAHDFFVAATYVMIAGAIVSLGAALTGFWDWWKGVEREPSTGFVGRAKHTQVWRTINWHMTVMLTVTGLVIVNIFVRLAQFDEGYTQLPTTMLSVLAAVLVSYGATYGGSLVYDYQFNVESLEGSTAWEETEVDQMPADHAGSEW
jgi:uncharacterized membrane protein